VSSPEAMANVLLIAPQASIPGPSAQPFAVSPTFLTVTAQLLSHRMMMPLPGRCSSLLTPTFVIVFGCGNVLQVKFLMTRFSRCCFRHESTPLPRSFRQKTKRRFSGEGRRNGKKASSHVSQILTAKQSTAFLVLASSPFLFWVLSGKSQSHYFT
jgi:hypothetical protein